MNIAVRYYTRSGNTKKLAEAIAGAVGVPALDVSVPLDGPVDILFLGSSVYAFGVDENVKRFIIENGPRIGKLCNFSTAAVVKSTCRLVEKIAKAAGVEMAREEFYCRGAFSVMHRGRPNEDDLRAAASFAKKIVQTADIV